MALKLELRQSQALVMTPQLQQAIKLLQLPTLDLAAFIEQEVERNPLLERDEGADPAPHEAAAVEAAAPADDGARETLAVDRALDDDGYAMSGGNLDGSYQTEGPAAAGWEGESAPGPWSGTRGGSFDDDGFDIEGLAEERPDLRRHLSDQLGLAVADPARRLIGAQLIEALDDAGYLTESLDEIAARVGCTEAEAEATLTLVQGFDPSGVFARSLAECLALQLKERDRFDPAMQAMIANLELVARRDFAALRQACGVDEEDLRDMLA
jgi:RNA polymerase sigma-54 factor